MSLSSRAAQEEKFLRFSAILQRDEGTAGTGIPVPAAIIAALGSGQRPKVIVELGAYRYRSTVAVYGGAHFVPLAKVHREAAGVAAGEAIEVGLALDRAPRVVTPPEDFAAALTAAGLRARFDALAYSHQREHVQAIEQAKRAETRARRIEKALQMLQNAPQKRA